MASRVTEAFALDACAASAVLSLVNVPLRNFSGIRAAIKLNEVCSRSSINYALIKVVIYCGIF